MISNENPHSQTPALSRGRVVRLWASLMLIDMACVAIAFAIVDITFFYFSPSPRPLTEYVYAFFFLGLYKLTVHPQYWVALWLPMRRRMDAYAPGVRAFFTLFLRSFIRSPSSTRSASVTRRPRIPNQLTHTATISQCYEQTH